MHELVLGSPSEWVLKGEGNANAVFGYAGTDPALIGRIIRVRKQPAEAAADHTSDKLTKDLWGPDAEQLSDVSQYFVPALGSRYLATGVQIQLSSDYVAGLNRQLKDNQQLHNPCESSLQMSSQSLFQQSTTQQGLNNEDKHAQSQHDEALDLEAKHAIKKRVSRFQLQQHLKLAQGKISSISAYDPLDLFSGGAIRTHKALVALIANPQNNLKFFMDGKPVDTLGLTAQPDSAETLVGKSFGLDSDSMKPGDAFALLANVLTDILLREGVLPKLLSIQALDAHDIMGIYPFQFSEFQEGFDLVAVPKIAVQIKYKLTVVDLDVKPHSKILNHYCLDQDIMKQQAME
ncbi:hypothetical protein WJX79_008244 [Trebouxia sp. C0005]